METILIRSGALAARVKTVEGIAREEFDDLVRLHQRRIYRVLLALLRDPDVAETLTQECFLRAYRSRNRFRGDSSVGTWLARIAVNLAVDYRRSRRNAFWRRLFGPRRSEAAEVSPPTDETAARVREGVADPAASPERKLVVREELQAVWAAVEGLSPQQRDVFVLRFAEEMTLEEIAQAMVLKVGTVKAHLARAVGAVRKRLKEGGPYARASDRRTAR